MKRATKGKEKKTCLGEVRTKKKKKQARPRTGLPNVLSSFSSLAPPSLSCSLWRLELAYRAPFRGPPTYDASRRQVEGGRCEYWRQQEQKLLRRRCCRRRHRAKCGSAAVVVIGVEIRAGFAARLRPYSALGPRFKVRQRFFPMLSCLQSVAQRLK